MKWSSAIVQIKTYSPFFDQWHSDPTNEFTIRLALVPEPDAVVLAAVGGLLVVLCAALTKVGARP